MGGVYYDARINGEQLQKDIAAINAKLNGLTGNVQKAGNEMDGVFRKLAGAMAGYFSLNFGAQFVTSIAKVRGEFQQLEVAFETMLDSKDKADKLMAQVVEFAAKTPFELKDVGSGAKSLLAFGVAAEDLMPTLKSLGDVAAGLSVPIDRLILNFGQIKTQGQLTGRELRDFAVAGVPLIATLSQTLKKSESDIQDMVSAGKIGFKDVQDAFTAMSSEGGRFANLMEKQSKTITGMQANLRDAWDQMLNDMGKNTEGLISGSIQAATNLVTNYEKVIDILKILATTYGAYKAAVIAANIVMGSSQIPAAIANIVNLTKAVRAATTAQVALNTAQKASIIGLAVAAVAALVTGLSALNKAHREAAKESVAYQNELDGEIFKVEEVFKSVTTANQGTDERKAAIAELNKIYGSYISNLITEKSTLDEVAAAQRQVTAAIAESITARFKEAKVSSLTTEAAKQQEKLAKDIVDITEKFTGDTADRMAGQFDGMMTTLLKNITERAKAGMSISIASIANNISTIYKNVTDNDMGANAAHNLAMQLNAAAYAAKGVTDGTAAMEEQTRAYLKTLGLTESQIGQTSEAIKKTVKDQIAETERMISEANAQLKKLIAPESTATEDEIKAQRDAIKTLQERYNTLTGFSKKAENEYNKAENERLKSAQELAEKEIDIIRRTQSAKIAVMQEGADRQRAEAKLEYDQQIADIEKFAADYIAAINEDTNLTTTQKQSKISFVNDQTTEQKAAASQAYANELVKIEKDVAEQISQLWRAVNEQYASDRERELADIRGFYASKIAEARKAKDEELALALEATQKTAENRVDTKYYIEKLNLEEEVADRQIEISQGLFESEENIEKKRVKNAIKYAQIRIDYYTKLGKDLYKKEITGEISGLNALNAGIDAGIGKGAQKVITSYQDISALVRTIDSDVAEWMDKMGGIAEKALIFNNALGAEDILSKVTSGIGLATTVIAMVIEGFKELNISFSEVYEDLQKKVNEILEDINTVTMAMRSMGSINYSNNIDVLIKQMGRLAISAKTLNDQTRDVSYGSIFDIGEWDLTGTNLVKYFREISPLVDELNKKLLLGVGNLSQAEKDSIRATLETYNEVASAVYDTISDMTGTSVDDLTESLVNAFLAGEEAATQWGETIDDIIKNIVIKQFTATVLTKPIQEALLQFTQYSKNGPDEASIFILQSTLEKIFADAKGSFEALEPMLSRLGVDLYDTAEKIKDGSLTGSIKGITEETAGLIAGQFMAMRENLLGVLNQSRTISDIMPSMSTYMLSINERLGITGVDITSMRYTSEQIQQNGLLQLAAINESVTHLASIDKKATDLAKLNSIDARLEEMNKNIKNL